MIKIAITGNIGSGKSTITKIIRELGFKVFDSDKENPQPRNLRQILLRQREPFTESHGKAVNKL